MAKWLENDMILRLVSIILGTMLWLTVTDTSLSSLLQDSSATTRIRNVDVTVLYDSNRYKMEKKTTDFELTLRGHVNLLNSLSSTTYQLVADARGKGPGSHKIPIKIEGLPAGIQGEVEPAYIEVLLDEKVQIEMPVEVDLVGTLPDGFKAATPIVQPRKVLVKGTESELEKVKSVKAIVPINGGKSLIKRNVRLQAYGENEPISQVEIEPQLVTVQIPINMPSKEVPLRVRVKKFPPPHLAIEEIKLKRDVVTVYGTEKYLETLQVYEGPELDLSGITEDRVIQMPIPIHDDAMKVEPKDIEIYVKMVRAETKALSGVPLQITGIPEGLKARLISPSKEELNITLSGAPMHLKNLDVSAIQAVVDVSNLPSGTYEIPVQFVLPNYIQVIGQSEMKVKVKLE